MTFCVEMTDITKYYSQNGVLANDDISLEVYPNEIHAIIGENGAGKTTLMKVLYGLVRPDHGEIRVYGKNVKIHSPKDAAKLGIFMLQQHSSLINEFTVTENIVLNREPRKYGIFYDREKADRKVQKILNDYDFKMDPKEKIQNLSMHQRQQVEIAKALYQEADILILDEPTAFLPEQEMRFFFQMLKGLIQEGKTILIISHKINEVKDLADRITILRRGKMLGTKKKSEFDMKKISELMIGKTRTSLLKRKKFSPGKIILELKNLCFQKKKALVLNKVNFQLRKGEILGIAGISGNGLDALEDILFGFARASSGQILYQEQDITYSSIKKRRNECNISYIPADNLHRGASLEATVLENLLVCHSRSFWKSGIYPDQKLHGQVKNFFQQFHVIWRIELQNEIAFWREYPKNYFI